MIIKKPLVKGGFNNSKKSKMESTNITKNINCCF